LQIYIDSSKRLFDIDLDAELKRLKQNLDITKNKYPQFWKMIHSDFNTKNINNNLKCPMNYMSELSLMNYKSSESTIPISEFFVKYETTKSEKQKNRKVEELINKYSLELYDGHNQDLEAEDYLLLKDDFEDMIAEIQKMYISKNYYSLYSWLLDRAFIITSKVKVNRHNIESIINKNKSLLFKTLYTVNPKMFLECFTTEN
jgi:hypothetical protein